MKNIKFKIKENLLLTMLVILLICLTVWMLISLLPLLTIIIQHIKNENVVISDITNYGIKGVFILMAMQILQVVTFILPSVPIQILAGLIFGSLYGMLICLAGYLMGNIIIFALLRQVNKTYTLKIPEVKKTEGKQKWDFSFIHRTKNAALFAFVLVLIPGIPNGILPYIFARTNISLSRYLLSIFLAGMPSIFLVCYAGERIANGDIITAALIGGILLLISLAVILFRNRITSYFEKMGNNNH